MHTLYLQNRRPKSYRWISFFGRRCYSETPALTCQSTVNWIIHLSVWSVGGSLARSLEIIIDRQRGVVTEVGFGSSSLTTRSMPSTLRTLRSTTKWLSFTATYDSCWSSAHLIYSARACGLAGCRYKYVMSRLLSAVASRVMCTMRGARTSYIRYRLQLLQPAGCPPSDEVRLLESR